MTNVCNWVVVIETNLCIDMNALQCLVTVESSTLILVANFGSVEMWKCGNMSSLSLSNNSGSVEMWKYVFNVLIHLITLEV